MTRLHWQSFVGKDATSVTVVQLALVRGFSYLTLFAVWSGGMPELPACPWVMSFLLD
jgi:hypothetical protein